MKTRQGVRHRLERLPLEVIKTGPDQYDIFTKKTEGKFVTYSNRKFILHIPLSLSKNTMTFEKKRLRMYNCIKLRCLT